MGYLLLHNHRISFLVIFLLFRNTLKLLKAMASGSNSCIIVNVHIRDLCVEKIQQGSRHIKNFHRIKTEKITKYAILKGFKI